MADSLRLKIGKGVLWSSSGTILIKLVGLASIFLILNRLGVYEYGLLELVMTIVSFFGIFLLPGINDVVIADIGTEKSKGNLSGVKAIFWNYFWLQLVLAVIAWVIILLGAQVIAGYYNNPHVALFLRIASFSFLVAPFRSVIYASLSVNFEFFYQSFYTFFEEVFKFILTVLMFFVFNLNAEGVILARVLAEFLSVCVMLPVLLRTYAPLKKVAIASRLHFFHLVRAHGKWGMFAKYLDSFGKNARIWIIKLMLGTEAVGLFAVADGLFGHTASLVPINRIVTPIIPQYIESKVRFFKLIDKSIKYQFIGYSAAILLALIVFPPVISFLFPNYVSAIPLFHSFLPILIPASFASIFTTMFYAYKAQASLFKAIGVKVISTFVLTPLCIYAFGFYGISISYFLVTLIFVLERYRVLRKIADGFTLDIRDFFTVDEIDREILRSITGKVKTLLRI